MTRSVCMKAAVLLLTVSAALAASGCLAVAAVAGLTAAVAYHNGELEASLDASPERVTAAAETVLRARDLPVLTSVASDIEGKVTSLLEDKDRITITAKQNEDGGSDITIRVGTYGDEELSRALFREIRDQLEVGS